MAKPYSNDLRARAIAIVEGGASRHEVAGLFEVSPSSVINWLRRWRFHFAALFLKAGLRDRWSGS
jgi:transposase